ncbi:Type III secretion system protein PrgH-EprH (PrgH) [Arsenophonus nasoniae]|uniref:PrgH/EprH family type III secretion apparatus protein n=2 Tax=Arsenophonus nasoniae TaxID=638 RepID=D2TZ29_9GAMM|nr:Type III secretion system protein PrgH-EprH (PrgH) [Arsenophonus nasoniae]WGM02302.1 PrgH/EprH family type III secretion apparatus protein [Arsenophonus nasoniae]CBA72789.1 type III secretion effector protein, PrgH [Arsenophonus nasoniae]
MEMNKDKQLVFRILNGKLAGCEFLLDNLHTVFMVTNDNTIETIHKGTSYPNNLIYIPYIDREYSFEIIIENNTLNANGNIIVREISNENVNNEKSIILNEINHVNDLSFAIRNIGDSFSEEVLHYRYPIIDITAERFSPVKKNYLAITLFFLLISLVIGICAYFYFTSEQRKISKLSVLLRNDLEHYRISYGQDNIIYLLANKERYVYHAIKLLNNSDDASQVKVLSKKKQIRALSSWLRKNFPLVYFHAIELDKAEQPVLSLSKERASLTDKEKSYLIKKLKKDFLFIKNVVFKSISDKYIENISENGIKKLKINYKKIVSKNSITFFILDNLSDQEIQSIKLFINNFYQNWGKNYIYFTIELNSDWLQDKSFRYGSKNYIRTSPFHYYFNKN